MSKDVVVKLRLEREGMVRGLADVKAGFDMVYRSASAIAEAFGDVMEAGFKYGNLLKTNTIDIAAARKATKGLVDEVTLLTAANTAAQFEMGLTEKQFAVFARAAVVQSQKLGIDASKALDDLLTGTARGSRRILDNLGFIVSEGAGVVEVVAEINKKVGEQGVIVDGAGGAWAQLKISMKNAYDAFSEWVSTSDDLGRSIKVARRNLDALSDGLPRFADRLGTARSGIRAWWRDMRHFGVPPLKEMRRELERIWRLDDAEARGAAGKQAKAAGLLSGMGLSGSRVISRELGGAGAGATGEGLFSATEELHGGPSSKRSARAGEVSGPGSGTSSGPYGLGNYAAAQMQLEQLERPTREAEARYAVSATAERELRALDEMTRAWRDLGRAEESAIDPISKFVAEQERSIELLRGTKDEIWSMTEGALASFAGAMWSVADAAVMTGESVGMAVAKMVKNVLLGLAAEATMKAVFQLAEAAANWWNGYAVAEHLRSAALYGIVAGAAGAGGIGASLGIKAAGGYGRSVGSSGGRAAADNTRRTSFESKRGRRDEQKIYVNVYLGGKNNPSALLLAKQQAAAEIKRAALAA